jgi:hypothetical protein
MSARKTSWTTPSRRRHHSNRRAAGRRSVLARRRPSVGSRRRNGQGRLSRRVRKTRRIRRLYLTDFRGSWNGDSGVLKTSVSRTRKCDWSLFQPTVNTAASLRTY